MNSVMTAAPGQPTGNLSCCGKPMQHVDSGIWECKRCPCYVTSGDGVIETVRHCRSHNR